MNPLASIAFGPQIAAAAERHHLDPTLLAAVAAQETGGPGTNSGRNVVGDGGHGHGLFQIDDRWHAFAATPAAMDPAKNADYAAGLLSGLLKTYGENVHMALSAYNAGSPTATGTTTNWGGRVLGYADSVLAHAAQLAGTTGAGTALAARDAAFPDAASNAASVNGLQQIASLLAGQNPDTSALSSAASADEAVSATPAPAIPAPTDHGSHDETALHEDLGLDDDASADPSQTTISA
jgi:hypothetical protein